MATTFNLTELIYDVKILGPESLAENELIFILKSCDDLYFNDDAPALTDNEYDSVKRFAQSTMPTHPYFLGVGSSVRSGAVKLPFGMGSLNQKYEGEMVKWVSKWSLEQQQVVITDKLDGTSALALFNDDGSMQIAYSKGDGFEGADITRHLSRFKSIPKQINQSANIRGEVILTKSNFETLKTLVKTRSGETYKNPRNMVAGLMNAEKNDPVVYDYLDFVAYDMMTDQIGKEQQIELLRQLGFKTPVYSVLYGGDLNDNMLTEYLNFRRDATQYEIDGIVIEVNDKELRRKINPSKDTLNPEYSVKYKVADSNNLATTRVIEVEWNLSKDGYYKPRVKIEPVELVGVTIQHATGFNAKFIKENKVGPGALIKITRSGDVIPFIIDVVEPSDDVILPDGVWTATGVDLVVANADQNDTVKFQQLNDFFLSLDAPHLREGNLRALYDVGYKNPEDIITMSQGEMCNVLGKAVGLKAFNGLQQKLTNIPAYTLMGCHKAFGRGVGTRKMKKLFEAFKGDMSLCTSMESIIAVEGFDQKTATKVCSGYEEYCQFFDVISKYVTFQPYSAQKEGKLSGKSFVFTGFRNKALEQQIQDFGGKVSTSVSKQTTAVIAQDPSESSTKLNKAREVGVDILSLQEFLNTLQ